MTTPPTPSSRMATQSTLQSHYRPPHSAQKIADDWLDELAANAEREDRTEPIKHFGRHDLRAVRFVLADGGPIADITFVLKDDREIDFAVLDYSEGTPRAHRVLTGYDAERLFHAFGGDDEQ